MADSSSCVGKNVKGGRRYCFVKKDGRYSYGPQVVRGGREAGYSVLQTGLARTAEVEGMLGYRREVFRKQDRQLQLTVE